MHAIIMRDKGFDKAIVQEFETSDRRNKGHYYGLRKMFWEYLNKLNVPFYDPCCESANSYTPVVIIPAASEDIAAGTGGAISVANYFTSLSTDAGGDAYTLANGTILGQLKKIKLLAGDGSAVITVTSLVGGTTITMDTPGDAIVLSWNGSAWAPIENTSSVIA